MSDQRTVKTIRFAGASETVRCLLDRPDLTSQERQDITRALDKS